MEFPELGDHCCHPHCQALDFLPVKCQHCSQVYCGQHFQPFDHDCQHLPAASQGTDESEFKHPCSAEGCRVRELVAVTCVECGANYCLHHRHPPDHECPSLNPQPFTRQDEARQRVEQIAAALSSQPKKKAGHKDPKLAAKVQLMKLKQRAVLCGSSTMLQEDRLYLLVLLPLLLQSPPSSRSVAVCLSSSWTVGRALDAVADLAKISNLNNQTSGSSGNMLQLYRHHNGSLLAASARLADLLAAGGLCNGETLVLESTARGQLLLQHLDQYTLP